MRLKDADTTTHKELIHHTLRRNYIHVCLVESNKGIPFISAIELRPLPNETYEVKDYSLALIWRYDTGQNSKQYRSVICWEIPKVARILPISISKFHGILFILIFIGYEIKFNGEICLYRYPSDVHDRIWYPFDRDDWVQINTSLTSTTDDNSYQVPSVVMCSAATPENPDDSMNIFWLPSDNNAQYQIYMHFAEVEKLQANESRQLNITLYGNLYYGPFSPDYMSAITIYSVRAWSPTGEYIKFSILKDLNSTLPPILNAYEIYMVKPASQSETNQDDS